MITEVIFRCCKGGNRTLRPDYCSTFYNVFVADFKAIATDLLSRYAIVSALITDDRGTRFICHDALINIVS